MLNHFALPLFKERNIFLFYLLTITTNAFFIVGNWIFFWTRFMTYGQLGIVDASCFAFGMLMEVPTGAVSDLIGKKKTLLAALFFSSLGVFIISPSSQIAPILIGFMVAQAGWALYSGAAEAFAYDTLKEKNLESHFDEVISASSMIAIITTLFSTLAGIWLYSVNFRLPHYMWAVAYAVGFVLCFFLREPKVDTERFSLRNYFNQLSQGMKQLLMPVLKPFFVLIFILLGVYYLYNYGFIKPAMAEDFGWYAREQGWLFAGLSLFSAALARAVPWMRNRFSDMQGLVLLAVVMGVGFILSSVVSGWFGLLPFLLIVGSGTLSSPWVSVVINREIPSTYRATTISTVAMLTKIPYILAAIIAGKMIEDGYLWVFTLVTGSVTLAAILVSKVMNGRMATVKG